MRVDRNHGVETVFVEPDADEILLDELARREAAGFHGRLYVGDGGFLDGEAGGRRRHAVLAGSRRRDDRDGDGGYDALRGSPAPPAHWLLRTRAALFGHLLLDLGNGVVDADVGNDLPNLLRGRPRVARQPVVHARRRIGILHPTAPSPRGGGPGLPASAPAATADLTAAAGVTRRLTRQPRIARGLPLLRRLSRRIELHGFVARPHIDADPRLPVQHLRRFHHRAMAANRQL